MMALEKEEIEGAQHTAPALKIDAVGLFCPLPIVKLKLGMEKLRPGEILEILADDRGFPEDVVSWCRETGNRLRSLARNGEGIFLAYVEKTPVTSGT
jgi:TusA-related sulfurtransferase